MRLGTSQVRQRGESQDRRGGEDAPRKSPRSARVETHETSGETEDIATFQNSKDTLNQVTSYDAHSQREEGVTRKSPRLFREDFHGTSRETDETLKRLGQPHVGISTPQLSKDTTNQVTSSYEASSHTKHGRKKRPRDPG